jgi:hypothetical protein
MRIMSATPTPQIEALQLLEDALRDLELGQAQLTAIAMRAGRVARLLNDTDYEAIFKFEVGGYPTTSAGIAPEIWRLATLAQRQYTGQDVKTGTPIQQAYTEPIETLESLLETAKAQLATMDSGDAFQRLGKIGIPTEVKTRSTQVAARRALLFDYLSSRYYELRYSGIAADIFSRLRLAVGSRIAELVPSAAKQFDSAYRNLQSDNPEDWANAVHSCRRILEQLADVLFPPTDTPRVKNGQTIGLGAGKYKNRLICYVEDHARSDKYAGVVGSSLSFLVDRLDSLFEAANKGTHASVTHSEADRYVVYTYLIVGDILSV